MYRRYSLLKKLPLAFAVACVLGFDVQPIHAQTVATSFSARVPVKCRFSKPARIVTSLHEIPDVAAEFHRIKLDIADVGEQFVPFDVEDEKSKDLPHRQFVRAYIFSDKTIVWYYRGGLVTNFHVVELRMRRGAMANAPLVLRLTGRTLSGPPCAATEAVLAGVDGGQGW